MHGPLNQLLIKANQAPAGHTCFTNAWATLRTCLICNETQRGAHATLIPLPAKRVPPYKPLSTAHPSVCLPQLGKPSCGASALACQITVAGLNAALCFATTLEMNSQKVREPTHSPHRALPLLQGFKRAATCMRANHWGAIRVPHREYAA